MRKALTYCRVIIGTLVVSLTTSAKEASQATDQDTKIETLSLEQDVEKTASLEEDLSKNTPQAKTKNKKKVRKSRCKTDKKTQNNKKSKKSKLRKIKPKTPTVADDEKPQTENPPAPSQNLTEEPLPEDPSNSNKYGK